MSVQFNCFSTIHILNIDSSINTDNNGGFDFSLFDYIDLSYYGGNKFTKVTSVEELHTAFAALGIEIEVTPESEIALLTEIVTPEDIQAFSNPCINLKQSDGTVIDPLNFSIYNSIFVDIVTPAVTIFVYSESQLKTKLKNLLNVDILINGNFICFDKYEGAYHDLVVGQDSVVTLVDDTNTPVACNYNVIQSINLSAYGGLSTVFVNSDASIINAFSALGINVTIVSCNIKLLEYLGPATNIPVCFYPIITLQNTCVNDVIDYTTFQHVDFTPFGGTWTEINNQTELVNTLAGLNIVVQVDGCNLKVLNQPCNYNYTLSVATRQDALPTAVDDNLNPCLVAGTDYTFNPVSNDFDDQNQVLTIVSINNTAVVPNGAPVVINIGTTAQLLTNNNIKIVTTSNAIDGLYTFTYTVMNEDGAVSTATVTYCVSNQIITQEDYLTFECDSSASIDVTGNDSGPGILTVTHINNIPIAPEQQIDIIPNSLTAALDITATIITLTSINMYSGMGNITYTITNGGATSSEIVTYNITNGCNPCIQVDFSMSNNCIETCWTSLTFNGNVVTNYLLRLKKPDGSLYVLPSGMTFGIGAGSFASPSLFGPNQCAIIEANTYSLYIEFSDIGNDIDCFANLYTVTAMPCGSNCSFNYSGPGGPAAQLAFDIVVQQGTVITTSFGAFVVPDGMVISYNGNVIYHTGVSAACPYISSGGFNQQYGDCLGCNYMTGTSNQTATTPVPYVSGVDTAQIIVFGYSCSAGTAWNLSISTTCSS